MSTKDPLFIAYEDTECLVPIHDEQQLFEFLIFETFQAGLLYLKKEITFVKVLIISIIKKQPYMVRIKHKNCF